ATSQGDGAVSWLSYAFRVMQLPLGLFGVAVAQATLPVISRQAAENRQNDMAETICHSIRLTSFVNLFACFAIMALAEPVIRVLFQHGRFTTADTIATAVALRAYAVGLLFFCLVKVLGPAFYALDNTRIPVAASVTAVVVNIILNLALIQPCGYWGLALGTGIGAVFNAGILFVMLSGKLGGFSRFGLGKAMFRIVFATGVSGIAMYYCYNQALNKIMGGNLESSPGFFTVSILLLISLTFGTGVLYLVSHLLHLEEAGKAKDMVMRKLFRR
ncbi:MAG: murein biosynthesis integral membrane protein MurJ, partial [Candidatus Rifleibacteriota bacterium]